MYDDDLVRGNPSTNYYGTLHEVDHDAETASDHSWRNRGSKSVSMLADDDPENTFVSNLFETCDADNWPGFCCCECDVQCAPPCCSVRRPLRCAGIFFLVLSILEACGLFSVSLAIATTEWNNNNSSSTIHNNTNRLNLAHHVNPTLINQACSNSIMAMYASLCFFVFSIQSIRDESKIQLFAACAFSVLVVLYVALHLHSDRFGSLWIQVSLR
jgi:hypothetical protein